MKGPQFKLHLCLTWSQARQLADLHPWHDLGVSFPNPVLLQSLGQASLWVTGGAHNMLLSTPDMQPGVAALCRLLFQVLAPVWASWVRGVRAISHVLLCFFHRVKDDTAAHIASLKASHQREIEKLLCQNAIENSSSKVAELTRKITTQEVAGPSQTSLVYF